MKKLLLTLLILGLTVNCFADLKPKTKVEVIKVRKEMLEIAKRKLAEATTEDIDFWDREVQMVEDEIRLLEEDEIKLLERDEN